MIAIIPRFGLQVQMGKMLKTVGCKVMAILFYTYKRVEGQFGLQTRTETQDLFLWFKMMVMLSYINLIILFGQQELTVNKSLMLQSANRIAAIS